MGNYTLELQEPIAPDTTTSTSADSEELLIYIIDVGQGNATLILGSSKNGKRTSLLIDAGGLDPDGGAIVTQLLQELGIAALDYALLTHYDADHMGGFVTTYESTSVLWDENCQPTNYFPTQAMIDLGASDKETDSVLEYSTCRDANADLLENGHIVIGTPARENIGYQINFSDNYSATIIAGNGYVIDQSEPVADVDTDNEKSIAVLVSGPNDFNFLITGDLPGQAYSNEDALVETTLGRALQARSIDVSVLHVGHHGSATSSTPEFLQDITPDVAIISVGDNGYGHPHCDTVANLIEYSKLVLQTENGNLGECPDKDAVAVANGNILMTVKETNYSITTPEMSFAF